MPDFWNQMTSGFMPHGYCLLWNGPLLFVFIAGNIGIAIAYFIIPLALRQFIGARKDLPYPYMFKLFAVFILSCGFTHVMKVWTIYQPVYWIEAGADLWTAVISLLTAILFLPLIPKALALRSARELQDLNKQLSDTNTRLSESERKFRAIFDHTYELIGLLSPDGKVLEVNKAALDFQGVSPEDVIGQSFWETAWFIHSLPLQERIKDAVAAAASGQFVRMENCHITAAGTTWVDFSIKPVFDESGEVIMLLPEGRDITDLRRVADSVKEQTELIELTQDTIIVRDFEGVICFWNHGAESMYGFSKAEAIGQKSYDLLKTEFPQPLSEIESELLSQGRWDGELIHYAKSGKRVIVAGRWTLGKQSEHTLGKILQIHTDITSRKEAEDARAEYSRRLVASNNDLLQFAFLASHDLQEPLRTVKNFGDLLNKKYGTQLDQDAKKYLVIIVEGISRMQQLVKDLLNYARVDTQGKPLVGLDAFLPLGAAINSLGAAVGESHAEITFDEMPKVMGDSTQLSVLFQNLIGNAIKYRGADSPKVHIGVRDGGSEWRFVVSDNGIGFNMEFAERIFAVFKDCTPEQSILALALALPSASVS